MQFLNKVVIVSGAAYEPGRGVALTFAKRSARLSLVGNNKEGVKKTAELCEKVSKAKVLVNIVDKNEDMKRVVADTLKEYGRIDVVVNCMKKEEPSFIEDLNLMQRFDETMERNVKSVVTLTHYAVKPLSKTKGVILNILSCSAKAVTSNVPYDVTQSLLNSFSRHLALELAPKGIRVNAILPWDDSKSSDDINGHSQTKLAAPKLITSTDTKGGFSQLPLKKLVKPEDVGELATFLANHETRSITGASYVIDSGALLLR